MAGPLLLEVIHAAQDVDTYRLTATNHDDVTWFLAGLERRLERLHRALVNAGYVSCDD